MPNKTHHQVYLCFASLAVYFLANSQLIADFSECADLAQHLESAQSAGIYKPSQCQLTALNLLKAADGPVDGYQVVYVKGFYGRFAGQNGPETLGRGTFTPGHFQGVTNSSRYTFSYHVFVIDQDGMVYDPDFSNQPTQVNYYLREMYGYTNSGINIEQFAIHVISGTEYLEIAQNAQKLSNRWEDQLPDLIRINSPKEMRLNQLLRQD